MSLPFSQDWAAGLEFLEAGKAILSGISCGPEHKCLTMSRRCSPAASSGHACSLRSEESLSFDHIEATTPALNKVSGLVEYESRGMLYYDSMILREL